MRCVTCFDRSLFFSFFERIINNNKHRTVNSNESKQSILLDSYTCRHHSLHVKKGMNVIMGGSCSMQRQRNSSSSTSRNDRSRCVSFSFVLFFLIAGKMKHALLILICFFRASLQDELNSFQALFIEFSID